MPDTLLTVAARFRDDLDLWEYNQPDKPRRIAAHQNDQHIQYIYRDRFHR